MGTKKYVIYPGFIRSKHDGELHYIGAMELMRLYGVDPRECLIYEHVQVPAFRRIYEENFRPGMKRLYTNADGKYDDKHQ